MKVTANNYALVAKLLNPFYQAQQIIARLLHLRPVRLTQLEPEQQVDLLCELVTQPKTVTNGIEREVRLLAVWAAGFGYKPWWQQPATMLSVQNDPNKQDWAAYLTEFAQVLGNETRHAWALFEIQTVPEDWMAGSRRIQYILVPLIDCVHQHAEALTFHRQAA